MAADVIVTNHKAGFNNLRASTFWFLVSSKKLLIIPLKKGAFLSPCLYSKIAPLPDGALFFGL